MGDFYGRQSVLRRKRVMSGTERSRYKVKFVFTLYLKIAGFWYYWEQEIDL